MKFQKGVPYFEALQRLNAAFSPKPGDLFTHTQLQAVIQADETRYRGVIAAWMKELRARGLQPTGMGRARGIGIAICDGREHAAHVDRQTFQTHYKTKRNAVSVENVDMSGFTEAELAQHNIRRRNVHALADFAAQTAKAIRATPPPVAGDNVRLFKKDA